MSNFGHQHERVTSVVQQRPLTLLGSPNTIEYNATTAFVTTMSIDNSAPAESADLTNVNGALVRKVLRVPPAGVMGIGVLFGAPAGALAGANTVNLQLAINAVLPMKHGGYTSDPIGYVRKPLLRLNAGVNAATSQWTTNFPHAEWFLESNSIGASNEFAFANDYQILYDGTYGNGASVGGRDRSAGTDMGGVQLLEFDNGGAITLEFLASLRLRDNSAISTAYAAQIVVTAS